MIRARHVRLYALIPVLVAIAAPPSVWAQSGKPLAAREFESAHALERPARLSVKNVQLPHALTKLYERSGVPVSFSPSLLPRMTVSCDCDTLTVARALEQMLGESGLRYREIDGHVLVYRPGNSDEHPRLQSTLTHYASRTPVLTRGLAATTGTRLRLPSVGTLVGTVAEVETGKPIVNAQIIVDGAGRAFTDAEGRYRITNVPVGRRSISVRSIGYGHATQDVDVGAGETVTVDFALDVSPSQLDAVVVTVTGEQRLRELGHVVGRINADSVVKAAPITSVSQLLTGRVAGLQVFQSSGIVGGDVQLQVRTPNSLLLGTQPIVIVDGVRFTNTAAFDPARTGTSTANPSIYGPGLPTIGRRVNSAADAEVTSPLNDLNVNDIESIEVVKGPSAVTLYGTDAANGVIVIRTKRGVPGETRWSAYVSGAVAETPRNAIDKDRFWAWGSGPDGSPLGSYDAQGRFIPANCVLAYLAMGVCARQDSITRYPSQYDDRGLTLFDSAPQWDYGLRVSGGGDAVRYYVSGSMQQETGPVRMPRALADSVARERGTAVPKEQLRPNTLRNVNLRSNLVADLGERVQISGNLGYVRRRSQTIDPSAYQRTDVGPPGDPYGGSQPPSSRPEQVFARTSVDNVDRLLFSGRTDWQPVTWLRAHGRAGMDLSSQTNHSLLRRGENTQFDGSPHPGEVQNEVRQQRTLTADVGATARYGLGSRLRAWTALGAQYTRSLNEVHTASGTGLVPGGESVVQADHREPSHFFAESVTLGSYAEQGFSLADRLFVTAALRLDGASNFGHDYQAATYPKVGVSWVVSDEPSLPRIPALDNLRIRYAFGSSGRQAYSWMKLPNFFAPVGLIEGSPGSALRVAGLLGNSRLRPERATEHEFGFDLAALDHRLNADLTWFRRRVVDQIIDQELPPGFGRMYTNLGRTTARGFELSAAASIVDTRFLSWDVRVLHSSSSTMLEDLGGALERLSEQGGYREGYPLGARFERPLVGFQEIPGTGIVVPHGAQYSDTLVYVGQSIPPQTQSLSSTIGLADRRIRLSALVTRSAGHVRTPLLGACTGGTCLELIDPSSTPEAQARALPWIFPHLPKPNVSADEVRLAEVAGSFVLPPRAVAWVGVGSGLLTVSGRNLAQWTDFPNGDPSSVPVAGLTTGRGAGIPQSRSWTIRFDLDW